MVSKIKQTITKEWKNYKFLMRSIPSLVMVFFVLSVVLMNLFANKELISFGWIALDCGFCLSWLSFLCMDMMTKRFGAKASIEISLTAVGINLIASLFFWLISLVPGNWGAFYTYEDAKVNAVLDSTIGGTWYVVLGSMTAFAIASIVNALINAGLGKLFNKNSFRSFALRSYVSTAVGQLLDNLIFALMVSHVFFGWSMTQVIMCSAAGALMELISEVIFSPIGYKVCQKWEDLQVGSAYIEEVSR